MATNQRNLLKKATFWSLCCLLFSGPISAQKVYPAYGLNDFVETADPENLRQQTVGRPFFGTSRRMGVDRYFIQKRKCPRK